VPLRAADGEVVVEISSFGLSSNNITYAETGDRLGYWDFFPVEGGWGSIPVWGFARVVESRHAVISPGTRVYGFLPPATHTVLRPSRCSPLGFVESSVHRSTLLVRVGAVLAHELMEINPRFPGVTKELRESLHEAKEMLEAQASRGAHAGPFKHEQRTARAAASDGWNGREPNTEPAAPADPPASE
jgi:hypothetical protein